MKNDADIAALIEAVARQYQREIDNDTAKRNDVRLEIVRKLTLISDAIKGLMKPSQMSLSPGHRDETASKQPLDPASPQPP